MYDLTHLKTFLAVVDHGGFIAAAEATHLSQPRVTQHVARLERQVGAELVNRTKRPVQLTDAGHALAVQARALLRAAVEAEAAMRPWGRDAQLQIVRLGVHTGASAAVVPHLLHLLAAEHPSITVDVTEQTTAGLDAALEHAQVDLCLRPLRPDLPLDGVERVPVWTEPVKALHAPDHPLADLPDPIATADLARHRLVTLDGLDTAGSDPDLTRRLLHRGTPAPMRTADGPHTLVAMAAAGVGVAITSALSLRGTDTSGVRIRPLAADVWHPMALCRITRRPLTPAAATVRDAILAVDPPAGSRHPEPGEGATRMSIS